MNVRCWIPVESHIKSKGVLVGNFEKKNPKGSKILFCERGLKP